MKINKILGLLCLITFSLGFLAVQAQTGTDTQPTHKLSGLVYSDYERRSETHIRNTFHVLGGYESDNFNVGVMYAAQSRTDEISGADDDELTLNVASVFTNIKMNEKWTAIMRADRMFEPNPQGPSISYIPFSDQAESTFFIFCIDFQPIPNIHITPNIESVFYGDAPDGTSPDSDILFRTTLYYTFWSGLLNTILI